MFKLSSLFENSVTKVGGAETSKFGHMPSSVIFVVIWTNSETMPWNQCVNYDIIAQRSVSEQGIK